METFPTPYCTVKYLAPARVLSQQEEWGPESLLDIWNLLCAGLHLPGEGVLGWEGNRTQDKSSGVSPKDSEGTQLTCLMRSVVEPPNPTLAEGSSCLVTLSASRVHWELNNTQLPSVLTLTWPSTVSALRPWAHWPVHRSGPQFLHLSGTFRKQSFPS